jgi:hypothetical protein
MKQEKLSIIEGQQNSCETWCYSRPSSSIRNRNNFNLKMVTNKIIDELKSDIVEKKQDNTEILSMVRDYLDQPTFSKKTRRVMSRHH